MKLTLIALGKLAKEYAEPYKKYQKLLKSCYTYKEIELKEAKNRNIEHNLQEEGKRIIKAVPDRSEIILLDLDGKQVPDSIQFSKWLFKRNNPTFIIGSSHGFAPEIKARASHRICFSALTFPHQLFRIMLYEQLYRAHCIKNHHPYHK